jgi:monoamine oxidase
VTAINYTNSNAVRVSYKDNGTLKQLTAKKVIVTVPLGVLKSLAIQFTPALPTTKQTAISKLGMGLMNKVVLLWSSSTTLPWPDSIEWVERIQPLSKKGRWEEFYNPTNLNGGRKMIIAWTVGREAQRVQNLTDVEAKNEALTSLREVFGNSSVPEPIQYLVTRWGTDPYSLGSYSYQAVGSTPQHRVNLAQNINNVVFFAGEATHSLYPSTTHGALMSGNTAATTVATLI